MAKQKVPMQFNPHTGEALSSSGVADRWRKDHPGAWLFNPWTGEKRTPQAIAKDISGSDIGDGVSPYEAILKAIRRKASAEVVLAMMDSTACPIDHPIGDHEETVLMVAAYHGNDELVHSLLKRGANPRARSQAQGTTVLQYGSRHSATLILLKDTDAKLDVNVGAPPYRFTPLMQALNISTGSWRNMDYSLVEDRLRCIRILFELGADVNFQNSFGHTAIMGAAVTGEPRFIEELLKHDPDLSIRCEKGKLAVDYTIAEGIKMMLNHHHATQEAAVPR